MEEIVLTATPRSIHGKQVKALRRAGQLPAIIYGKGITPLSISMISHDTARQLVGVTSSQLIVIDVNGQRHNVLIRDRHRHPVSGAMMHIDFQEVSLTEKLHASVDIDLVGDSPAVKELNAVIVVRQEQLEVKAFPQDLPERILVDISILKAFGDAIHVRDIVPPANVEVLTDPDELIVIVTTPTSEAKLAAEAPLAAGEEPEVIERSKKKEEEY